MKNLARTLVALVVFLLPAVAFATATAGEVIAPAEHVLTVADKQTATGVVMFADEQSASESSENQGGFVLFGIDVGAILTWAFAIVGVASALVKALAPIAQLTKTTKDDAFLAKAASVIDKVVNFLDKWVALNPNKSNARR